MLNRTFMLVALILGGSALGVGCSAETLDAGDAEEGAVEAEATAEAKGALETCGGITGKPCQGTETCVDDPDDDCDPRTAADCGGICIGQQCGGFAGFGCPKDHDCRDDPRDDCDPETSADCAGLCFYVGDES